MVASGEYADVASVCEKFVRVAETTYPDPVLAAKYEKRYGQFKKIYPACKELFAGLVEI